MMKQREERDVPAKPFPREWLEKYDDMELERLAIMTIDSEALSDAEALRVAGLA
jgi:hypothetical protein